MLQFHAAVRAQIRIQKIPELNMAVRAFRMIHDSMGKQDNHGDRVLLGQRLSRLESQGLTLGNRLAASPKEFPPDVPVDFAVG